VSVELHTDFVVSRIAEANHGTGQTVEARMGLVRIVHLIRTLEYIHKNDSAEQTIFIYDFNLARNRP
jgi:hypothetical protein